jgi:hypothetical protein
LLEPLEDVGLRIRRRARQQRAQIGVRLDAVGAHKRRRAREEIPLGVVPTNRGQQDELVERAMKRAG